MRFNVCVLLIAFALGPAFADGHAGKFASHPPIRPLATPTDRALASGPAFFVDPAKGLDSQDGSQARPWKTVNHAIKKLKPGATLYLRGGIYYEHVVVANSATKEAPITIRAYPEELVTLDGGLREFFESPEKAWEPVPDGAAGEFRSVKEYPNLGSSGNQTHLLGNFGDSMVPLQGYKYMSDLRSNNVYFNLPVNTGPEGNIYCGPGICHDLKTNRIHVRLAHTNMKYLPAEDNYTGETDPRRVPLVIAGHAEGPTLSLRGVKHVHIFDLVVRGARDGTIEVSECENVVFDGLTVYGGRTCFVVKETVGLQVLNTACRGIAAPWTFRGSLKYRAIEARLFSASGWTPTGLDNRDFELAYCEFTDSVDGVFVGSVRNLRFHHNLLDNVTDDGLFLTAGTAYDGVTSGGNIHIYQNLLSRCLTTFAFGVGHGRQKVLADRVQTGAGVNIYRNVFDYRRPLLYHQPRSADEKQEVTSKGRFASDHGSPAWEPMNIYHNTILADDAPRYTYGTYGLANGMGKGTTRRVFNNIVVQTEALPGATLPPATTDFQADCNVFWSLTQGSTFQGDFWGKFRRSPAFADSKKKYPPGWGVRDIFADPKLVCVSRRWQDPIDMRLAEDSPAIDAGIAIPKDWPDPLRGVDPGNPDIGALPFGAVPWHVGVRGRLTMFGQNKPLAQAPSLPPLHYTPNRTEVAARRPAVAIVEGYPAFDVPLLAFALRRQNMTVDIFERRWLEPVEFGKYHAVVFNGNLLRAKAMPNKFTAEHLKQIDAYLKQGGTVILTLSGRDAFNTPDGRKFLADITGQTAGVKGGKVQVLDASHRWVKHLDPKGTAVWLGKLVKTADTALASSKGQNILGTTDGNTLLYRESVGAGQFIYIGWTVHDSLPYTRDRPSSVEDERNFEDQMNVLFAIARDLSAGAK
jgi:hypothetical protein